jgi:hypothetical protein
MDAEAEADGVGAKPDLQTRIDNARQQLEQFEKLLSDAYLDHLIKNFGPDWGRRQFDDHQRDFDWHLLRDFFEPYQSAGFYPIERLPGATYWLLDLKLQHFLIVNCIIPIQNTVVFGKKGFTLANPRTHPMTYLDHICITQAMIGQVRALWDRLMGLVYFLETGKNLQQRRLRGSARRRFFHEIVDWGGRWEPLREWESELEWYDAEFRTPEFHNNSRLRAGIFKQVVPDPNAIMTLLSPVTSGFWQLLVANVKGLEVPPGIRLGRQIDSERRMDAYRIKSEGPRPGPS